LIELLHIYIGVSLVVLKAACRITAQIIGIAHASSAVSAVQFSSVVVQ
jgi:hypothetical protein